MYTFIEPDIVPPLHGDEIPKPLQSISPNMFVSNQSKKARPFCKTTDHYFPLQNGLAFCRLFNVCRNEDLVCQLVGDDDGDPLLGDDGRLKDEISTFFKVPKSLTVSVET